MLQAMATGFDLQLQPDELELGLVSAAEAAAAKLAQAQLAPASEEEQQAAQQPAQQQPGQRQSPFASAAGAAAEAAGGDELAVSEQALGEPLQALLAGEVRSVEYSQGQVLVDAPRRRRVYLPGSFNPIHAGVLRARAGVAGAALLAAGARGLQRTCSGCCCDALASHAARPGAVAVEACAAAAAPGPCLSGLQALRMPRPTPPPNQLLSPLLNSSPRPPTPPAPLPRPH
jgi:hypothetical protein